jgi:hypothetical protein
MLTASAAFCPPFYAIQFVGGWIFLVPKSLSDSAFGGGHSVSLPTVVKSIILMGVQKIRPAALQPLFGISTYTKYAFVPEKSPSLAK